MSEDSGTAAPSGTNDRTPCCIAGCRRTFPRLAGDGEIMCGKHYRCDGELVRLFKQAKASFRVIERRWAKTWNLRGCCPSKLHLAWKGARRRLFRRWDALKAEAQRQQDAGFFAPRARGKRSAPPSGPDPLSSRFEDQFQRLKKGMRP